MQLISVIVARVTVGVYFLNVCLTVDLLIIYNFYNLIVFVLNSNKKTPNSSRVKVTK